MEIKRHSILIIVLAFALVCIGAFIAFELIEQPIRHWVDDLLYDNYNHYLSCEDLPLIDEVEAVVAIHKDTLDQIDQINPGLVGWNVEETCSGKGDILFWYASHANRNKIEEIIGSKDNFFGIPIRMRNQ
jgi:hypothetical protein